MFALRLAPAGATPAAGGHAGAVGRRGHVTAVAFGTKRPRVRPVQRPAAGAGEPAPTPSRRALDRPPQRSWRSLSRWRAGAKDRDKGEKPTEPDDAGALQQLWESLGPVLRALLVASPLVAAAAVTYALRASSLRAHAPTVAGAAVEPALAAIGATAIEGWLGAPLAGRLAPALLWLQSLASTAVLIQLAWLLALIIFIRVGAEPALRTLHRWVRSKGPWEKSPAAWLLRDVYGPLEVLLLVVAVCRVLEAIVWPQLGLPAASIAKLTQPVVMLAPILAAYRVVQNWKAKYIGELLFALEIEGKPGEQARIEAADKLLSIVATCLACVLSATAFGFDIGSLLAVGGIGGLAAGLAGRQVLENLFAGLLLFTTQPFVVGEEINFTYSGVFVDGIVIDVGWFRTTVRSFERELFSVPNSAITSVVVLNITRKGREWRLLKTLTLRLADVARVPSIVSDYRKLIAKDSRVLLKLHRRVFMRELTADGVGVYLSFYVDAPNRDAFLAIQEDLLLQFVDCVRRHGGELRDLRERVVVAESSAMRLLAEEAGQAAPRGSVGGA